ncbi:hypothetical protein [Actinomadura macrotermitis]|nr:hypothetical protein [Actinomadura macrotermitis]
MTASDAGQVVVSRALISGIAWALSRYRTAWMPGRLDGDVGVVEEDRLGT